MTKLVVNVDGGARGNPGPAAIGAVVRNADGEVLEERGERIGSATNNVAEYRALLLGIERAAALGATEVELVGDSELIVTPGQGRVQGQGRDAARAARRGEAGPAAVRRPGRSATFAASRMPRPTDSSTRLSTGPDRYRRCVADRPSEPIDPGVDIGHVHLKVADIERSLDFYCGVLGFELQQRMGDDAAFVSAGGYHHHIGLNTWHSKGGSPPPPSSTGLFHVAIRYPTRRALADALRRLAEAGHHARRRLRPRGQRGSLPERPRRQRRSSSTGTGPERTGRGTRKGMGWRWSPSPSTSTTCWSN